MSPFQNGRGTGSCSIIYITYCSVWRSSVWAGPENQIAQNFRIPKKLIRIVWRLPTRTSVTGKLKDLKIGAVFRYHVYMILKFSLNQIRNGFKTPSIGTQNRQTRNRSLNVWNPPTENDRLDSSAIILFNALHEWGVLPTDEPICEMDEKIQNFYHQIADLHISGNGELFDLIHN